ncbi:unnamed protein product [Mytilus coruscus]|uniref:Endonuclease/exonuclease/phosphatase domain-containing protein n=1 Tax=Mytilus coruscus TaxID=42192 RepID=A0A6J8D357_MYTCO|nr:unnamed protein product [Mytilus coruscus]
MVPCMSKAQTIHKSGNNTNQAEPKRLKLQMLNKPSANLTNVDNTDMSNGQHIWSVNDSITQASRYPQITSASDTTQPICPINTSTILDASSNGSPVTTSNDNPTPPDAASIPIAKPACQSNKCTLSLLTFNAVLDEIAEIVEKYGATADIILGGDMNASLHRMGGISRDKTFKFFLEEQKLLVPKQCRRQSTFHQYNGRMNLKQITSCRVQTLSPCIQHLRESQKKHLNS